MILAGGQENGFELTPPLSFDELIELVERPMVLPPKSFGKNIPKRKAKKQIFGAVTYMVQLR